MQVYRQSQIETDSFEIGDQIKVKINHGDYTATAIKKDGDKVLFFLDQILSEEKPMNEEGGTEGGYLESDMRRYLKDIEDTVDIKGILLPNEDGDLLWLLSLEEVGGYDEDFNNVDGQIEWLKDRKRRMAQRKGSYDWYWLRTPVSAAYFAFVFNRGLCNYSHASDALGVRPAFAIKA